MKFIIKPKELLKPVQQVSNLLGNRHQTLPILNNLLLQITDGMLLLISTDLEIKIMRKIILSRPYEIGEITIPARKFYEICRSLSEEPEITVKKEENRILVYSGRIRFFLSSLPASDFPNMEIWNSELEFFLTKEIIKNLIETTQFSMANQDVRYYLNGMLFEIEGKNLRTVTTDGHRLSLCVTPIDILPFSNYSVIIPRKSIVELMRILDNFDSLIHIKINKKNIHFYTSNFTFISKLINGRFPKYYHVFPKNPDKILKLNRDSFKKALSRVSILSNEKFQSVQLLIKENQLKITSSNLEKEGAEETLDVDYFGEEIKIVFNVNYLLDILKTLKCENVRVLFKDSMSSVQIENTISQFAIYVIMPIRI